MSIIILCKLQIKRTKTQDKTDFCFFVFCILFFWCFIFTDSCKFKDKTSLLEAKSVAECLGVLKDNELFQPSDVIFIQFLLRETNCWDLYKQCIKYAEEQNALCFYEKQSGKVYHMPFAFLWYRPLFENIPQHFIQLLCCINI